MSTRPGARWSDPKPCGTIAAYRRHYRHGEKPCRSCKQAAARYRADLRAARWTREILDDLDTMLAIAEGLDDGSLAEDDDGNWHRQSA